MATSNNSTTSILGILAIVILVGLAVFFVMDQRDDGLEINIGLGQAAPAGLMVV
jgi:hypothetical protein